MKIAIISDTHDNLPNFEKAVRWAKENGVETIIHCGDVACPSTLNSALADFSGRAFLSLGNADAGHNWEKRATSLPRQAKAGGVAHFKGVGKIEIGGKKIAFCHFPEVAKDLAKSGEYNLVFYGHTHKPWSEKIKTCYLVNPGNLAGILFQPTFAVFDTETDNLELKILQQL